MVGYLESVLMKYVIATVDAPTTYLVFQDGKILFTKHISRATKTVKRGTADSIVREFYAYTGRTDVELVVVPVRISYELLQDEDTIEGEDYELLS